MTFKDIPIGSKFIHNGQSHVKIDYNYAKNLTTKKIREFFLSAKIDVIEQPKFKINY